MTPKQRKNFESIRDNVHSEPMTQVEVMKLALEALGTMDVFNPNRMKAITALRQAIEQAGRELIEKDAGIHISQQKQEPVVTEGMVDAAIQAFWGYENKTVSRTGYRLAIEAALQDKFCDANCVWTDHHPNCVRAEPEWYHGIDAHGCNRFYHKTEDRPHEISTPLYLRQAIEQAQKQEPLCTAAMFDDAFLAKSGLSPDTKLYTSPPQQKQEPVANYCRECLTYNGHHEGCSHYTSPPKRAPLTDEEIDNAVWHLGFGQLSPREVARAIEAAHGIKGEA